MLTIEPYSATVQCTECDKNMWRHDTLFYYFSFFVWILLYFSDPENVLFLFYYILIAVCYLMTKTNSQSLDFLWQG